MADISLILTDGTTTITHATGGEEFNVTRQGQSDGGGPAPITFDFRGAFIGSEEAMIQAVQQALNQAGFRANNMRRMR